MEGKSWASFLTTSERVPVCDRLRKCRIYVACWSETSCRLDVVGDYAQLLPLPPYFKTFFIFR